jgi:hypothetical protein
MYFAAIQSLISSLAEYPIAVRVVGLFIPLWIWVYPLLFYPLLFIKDLVVAVCRLSDPRF